MIAHRRPQHPPERRRARAARRRRRRGSARSVPASTVSALTTIAGADRCRRRSRLSSRSVSSRGSSAARVTDDEPRLAPRRAAAHAARGSTSTPRRAPRPARRTHQRSVLQQHAQQRLHPFASRVRHLEQPQRMPGRRGVDDDRVIVGARVDDGEDPEQLVDAGRRQVHQLGRADRRRRPSTPTADAISSARLELRALRRERAWRRRVREHAGSAGAPENRARGVAVVGARTRRRASAPDRSRAAARGAGDPRAPAAARPPRRRSSCRRRLFRRRTRARLRAKAVSAVAAERLTADGLMAGADGLTVGGEL